MVEWHYGLTEPVQAGSVDSELEEAVAGDGRCLATWPVTRVLLAVKRPLIMKEKTHGYLMSFAREKDQMASSASSDVTEMA